MTTQRPDYSNSIVNLSCSVLKYFNVSNIRHNSLAEVDRLLQQRKPRNVVILLFDAMGISILDSHLPKDSFTRQHVIKTISSTFPPTTVAATTAVNSGLTPLETGWLGWISYFREIDDNIITFFNTLQTDGDKQAAPNHLTYSHVPYKTLSMQIREANPDVCCMAVSPFRTHPIDQTTITKSVRENMDNILKLTKEPGRHMLYGYWPDPDHMMHELGGAEIAGIKIHAAIDVVMRRNHIHHCTMGIWTDWEAQGTRITQNLLHDNQRPAYAEPLKGGMGSEDIFVEVGHGPTLIDNNILLSDATLRIATQGVAMVHNLICGAFTSVGAGTDWRYTPYHMPHRTEVMGFMTILHGDDRFYNNIFFQKHPKASLVSRFADGTVEEEERVVGTHVWDHYPLYEDWIKQFDLESDSPDMMKLVKAHFDKLPVWIDGNAYLGGALHFCKEKNYLVDDKTDVYVNVREDGDKVYLDTNLADAVGNFTADLIETDTLGKAFEPQQRFEDADGNDIIFDTDYFGAKRSAIIPGPFASLDLKDKNVVL